MRPPPKTLLADWRPKPYCFLYARLMRSDDVQVNVPHHEWQSLRVLARAKKPVAGIELRVQMTRKTKDGGFLAELVKRGLLKVETRRKDPFEATYSLTDLGMHAAEYGVYEVDWETYKEIVPG